MSATGTPIAPRSRFTPLLGALRQATGARFTRDVAVLQVSNTVQKLLAFAAHIALARLLGPEGYGQYVIVLSFFGTINLLGNVGLGPALVTRLAEAAASRDQDEVRRVAGYLLKTSVALALMVTAVIWLLGHQIAAWWYPDPEYGDLVKILALSAPLAAIFLVLMASLQSVRRMRELALVENSARVVGAGFGVGAVWIGLGLPGALSGIVLGSAAGCLLGSVAYQRILRRRHAFPSWGSLASAAITVPWRTYFRFSTLALLDKNIAGLFAQSPYLFLGRFASPEHVAYFGIATKVFAFLAAFHGAVARNLSVWLAQEKSKGDLGGVRTVFWRVTLLWTPLACVIAAGLAVCVPIFRWLYGPELLPSLPLVLVLAAHHGLMALGIGFGSVFLVTDRIGLNIAIKTPINLAFLPIGAVLIQHWGTIGAAAYIMAAYSAGYVAYLALLASRWFWRSSAQRLALRSEWGTTA